jgi:hypothetical protein
VQFDYLGTMVAGAGTQWAFVQRSEGRCIVRDRDFGLLVPPGDTNALAAALGRLVDDPSLRSAFCSNALKAAMELNWDTQETELRDLYDDLLDPKTKNSRQKALPVEPLRAPK